MKKTIIIFLATASFLTLAFCAWFFGINQGSADSNPLANATLATPPPAHNPPTEEDRAKSLALQVDQSITVLIEEAQVTLPIDQWTSLVALNSIKDIKPNATIGIRLTEDKKRVLVLNGAGMK
jgi:hypothetical protein